MHVMTREWIHSWRRDISQYAVVLQAFIAGRISGAEIEAVFGRLWLSDTGEHPKEEWQALGLFFAQADDLVTDPRLYEPNSHDVTEEELRGYAATALAALRHDFAADHLVDDAGAT